MIDMALLRKELHKLPTWSASPEKVKCDGLHHRCDPLFLIFLGCTFDLLKVNIALIEFVYRACSLEY